MIMLLVMSYYFCCCILYLLEFLDEGFVNTVQKTIVMVKFCIDNRMDERLSLFHTKVFVNFTDVR